MSESAVAKGFSTPSKNQDVNAEQSEMEISADLGRFWNSQEDLILVELWSKYTEEVISVDENKNIYKLFEAEMNRMNIPVNSSEIEIRMQYMWARYMYERHVQMKTGFKSIWRLYPILECVFEGNKIKEKWLNTDDQDEEKMLNELLENVNTLSKQPDYDFRQAASIYNNIKHQPLFREINLEKLLQIQCDNVQLNEQRNDDLQDLLFEKQMLKFYESLQENVYSTEKRLLNVLTSFDRQRKKSQQSIEIKQNLSFSTSRSI